MTIRTKLSICFITSIAFFLNTFGATLQVGNANIEAGSSGNVNVTLLTSGADIASLQFDLLYDSSTLTITGEAGDAAEDAGKGLNPSTVSGGTRFMLVGFNTNTIQDGVIVELSVKVDSSASGDYPLTLSNLYASDPVGAAVALNGTDGMIEAEEPQVQDPTLTGLTISGPSSINEGESAGFTATATYSDSSYKVVTNEATWSENSLYATINSSGILNTEAVPSDATLTVRASFSEGGITRSGTRSVFIKNTDTPENTLMYFPQFISGAGSSTEFILVNNCSEEKSGSIIFYSNESPEYQSGNIIRDEPYSIPARSVSVYSWEDGIDGMLQVGAVEVTQEGSTVCSIEGTEFFNALGSYTTVSPADLLDGQQIYALKNSIRDTGFAIYNPNSFNIDINVSYFTEEESLTTSFSLGPNGHKACYLGELFAGQQALIPENVPGTLNFHSVGGQDFALMGLFSPDLANNALVSLPTSPNAYEE